MKTDGAPIVQNRCNTCLDELNSSLSKALTPIGIQASNSKLFKGAIFGRDSLRVALDLLPWHSSVALLAITSLGRLQGNKHDNDSEEEPGKIPHEYRSLFLEDKKINRDQQRILQALGKQWGWNRNKKEVCYYGSIDATPQFIRLVSKYCLLYGDDILEQEIKHQDGERTTVREIALRSARWLAQKLKQSDIGLLEFCRTNPRGIKWQVLRDGSTAYIHPNGSLANFQAPIASIEVQGLAFDALLSAVNLFEDSYPRETRQWQRLAKKLQRNTLSLFWIPESQFFAMALDRDKNGQVRQVKTLTTLPGELLESNIFDNIPVEDRQQYVSSIAKSCFSAEFLTDVGIRARALRHFGALDYCDYQGSAVSWPVMTNILALGFRKQGLLLLANDLEKRMMNAVTISHSLSEFFYVTREGHVNYHPKCASTLPRSDNNVIYGTNIPEHIQAWTVSAVLRAKITSEQLAEPNSGQNYLELESDLLSEFGTRLINPEEAEAISTGQSSLHIDREEGIRREVALLEYNKRLL
ncbi:MAG: hypothetical protein WCT32_02255 [Patescibacteria group bacterium]|jgi:glycogen debranching enzyme